MERTRRVAVAMLLCAVMLGGAACGILVAVPDVGGQPQAAAESALTDAGLRVGDITQEFSDTVPAGQVIGQYPAAGTRVFVNVRVDLVVSRGIEPVAVPDVVGQQQADAAAALAAADLQLGNVSQNYSITVPEGRVISQSPLAGTSVMPGTAVAIVVSRGPRDVKVPKVTGQTQDYADSALAARELLVGVVSVVYSESVAAGVVLSQNPAAGTVVSQGSSVNLVVSLGPDPYEPVAGSVKRLLTVGQRVFVAEDNGDSTFRVTCLDAATGARQWTRSPFAGTVDGLADWDVDGRFPYSVDGTYVWVKEGTTLMCLDGSTGTTVWSDLTTADQIVGTTQCLYLWNDGAVRCLERATGADVWEVDVAGFASPVVMRQYVLASRALDSFVRGLHAATGLISFELVGDYDTGHSAAAAGRAYVAVDADSLACIDPARRSESWRADGYYDAVDGVLLVADGGIWTTRSGLLYSLMPADGAVAWSRIGQVPIAAGEGLLLTVDDDTFADVQCLTAATGATLWMRTLGDLPQFADVRAEGTVLVDGAALSVHDPRTGALRWQYVGVYCADFGPYRFLPADPDAQPAGNRYLHYLDGKLYVIPADQDGVVCLAVTSGDTFWQYPAAE